MDMIKAKLAALVAAYDEHGGKWPSHHKEALQQAVERARAVLAQPGPAAAADGGVADLALRAINEMQHEPIAVFSPFEELAEAMNLNLREGEATRLIGRALEIWGRPKPFHVSERLPGPEDCDAEGRCWWGDAGDDQFVPSWRLCEQPDDTHFTHWLPAHALPLPEAS